MTFAIIIAVVVAAFWMVVFVDWGGRPQRETTNEEQMAALGRVVEIARRWSHQ